MELKQAINLLNIMVPQLPYTVHITQEQHNDILTALKVVTEAAIKGNAGPQPQEPPKE